MRRDCVKHRWRQSQIEEPVRNLSLLRLQPRDLLVQELKVALGVVAAGHVGVGGPELVHQGLLARLDLDPGLALFTDVVNGQLGAGVADDGSVFGQKLIPGRDGLWFNGYSYLYLTGYQILNKCVDYSNTALLDSIQVFGYK